uniref:FtsW/RodA/SpoVE family cell cycle protein n=2 Tax=Sediminihabitans luteus TaxID=1138585 RepID=UPI0027E3E805|nr:FtsW/RodA/SpoVE family cell cycle protein [Sediminihabitans luteus]
MSIEPTARTPRRGAELVMLLLAFALGIGAYATVSMRVDGSLPGDFYLQSAGIIVLGLGMHLVLRWRAPYADQVILPIAVALNGIGLAAIYRYDATKIAAGGESDLAAGQLALSGVAVILAVVLVVWLRDHRALRGLTYTAMVVGLVLVMLPLTPIGTEVYGARIWINVAGFSFQPAEIAKIAFAIFFAGYLVTNRDTLALAGPKVLGLQLPRLRDLGPIMLVWVASLAILVFENDFGTSLLFFGLFVVVLYIATERVSWIVIGLGLLAAGATFAILTVSHIQQRMEGWLHTFDQTVYDKDPGGSFQLAQGWFSLANGGLFGTGWGAGYPQLVPFSYSDFIYTALGEQLGLTGLLAILALYLVLVERGLRTAIGVRDGFGKLLAGGLAFAIAIQVFVVVGGITRLIPLTGLTLPFLAQGGSSVLANWIIVALLLRVSDAARRPSALPVRGQVAAGGIVHHVETVDAVGEPDVGKASPIVVGPGGRRAQAAEGADEQGTELVPVIGDSENSSDEIRDDDATGAVAVDHATAGGLAGHDGADPDSADHNSAGHDSADHNSADHDGAEPTESTLDGAPDPAPAADEPVASTTPVPSITPVPRPPSAPTPSASVPSTPTPSTPTPSVRPATDASPAPASDTANPDGGDDTGTSSTDDHPRPPAGPPGRSDA